MFSDVHYASARQFRDTGKRDAALSEYGMAIRLNQRFTSAYAERADVRLSKSDFDNASADIATAIQLAPYRADLYHTRSKICFHSGDTLGAIRDMHVYLNMEWDKSRAYAEFGNLLKTLKNYDGAMSYYNIAIERNPLNSDAYRYRGWLWILKKDNLLAMRDCWHATRLNPSSAPALADYGSVLYCLHNYEGAVFELDKALKLDPYNSFALQLRSLNLQELGRHKEAISGFDTVIAITQSHLAYCGRARSRLKLGDKTGARHDLKEVLRQEPNDLEASVLLKSL